MEDIPEAEWSELIISDFYVMQLAQQTSPIVRDSTCDGVCRSNGRGYISCTCIFLACDKAIEDTLQEISRLAMKGEHGSQIKCYDVYC